MTAPRSSADRLEEIILAALEQLRESVAREAAQIAENHDRENVGGAHIAAAIRERFGISQAEGVGVSRSDSIGLEEK